MADTTIDIECSTGTELRTGEQRIRLRVVDSMSNECMAEVGFTPAEWWSLITGGTKPDHPAKQSPSLAARLGKRMENDQFMVPRGVIPYDARGDKVEHEALYWAGKQPWAEEWDTFEVRRQNNGTAIIARRWRDA